MHQIWTEKVPEKSSLSDLSTRKTTSVSQTEREEILCFCLCFVLFYSLFPSPGNPPAMVKMEATGRCLNLWGRGSSLTRGPVVPELVVNSHGVFLPLFSPLLGPADTVVGRKPKPQVSGQRTSKGASMVQISGTGSSQWNEKTEKVREQSHRSAQ